MIEPLSKYKYIDKEEEGEAFFNMNICGDTKNIAHKSFHVNIETLFLKK